MSLLRKALPWVLLLLPACDSSTTSNPDFSAVADLAVPDLASRQDLRMPDLSGTVDAGAVNGTACSSGTQCMSGHCADGVCCNTACSGSCTACSAALTGMSDGTCANASDGTSDPRGACAMTTATSCGTDGKCAAGACSHWSSSTSCGAGVSCSGNQLTLGSQCDGAGSCVTPSPSPCPAKLKCNGSSTACLTACGSTADCASDTCLNPGASGTCGPPLAGGSPCSADNQCQSGACGVSGNGDCCTAACTKGGTCGATSCNGSGSCVYPTPATACGAVKSCTGFELTRGSACNGAGACASPSPSPCPGSLKCNGAGTDCLTACSGIGDCAGATCFNPGASGTCGAPLSIGACTNNNQCVSNVCGINGTGNCCSAACTGGPCGGLSCNGSGGCVYPDSSTACGSDPSCSGHLLTPRGACDSNGGCTPGTPGPCPGSLKCLGDGSGCLGACSGIGDCFGTTCFNPGASGTCGATLDHGACALDNQCTSGVCGLAGTGNCCGSSCTKGGACGATGCDVTSANCLYPSGNSCGAAQSCGGSSVTPAQTCNGGGGCASPSPSPCPGGFVCNGDTINCNSSCGSDPECASSSDYCANPGLTGTCTGKVGDGAPCTASDQCSNGQCCNTPPADYCSDADTLTVYSNLDSCSNPVGVCSYPSAPQPPCHDGCSNGACNGSPSFLGDATATSTGGTVALVKEKNLDASTGDAPANANVVVTVQTGPENGYHQLTLNWTKDDFGITTPVTMSLQSQSGGVDTWTATITGQPQGTTVRFYFQAEKWDTTFDYSPGNFYNYTYVTTSLSVSIASGVGTVTSSPAGISCSQGNTGSCIGSFANGATVTLTPSPLPVKAWGAGPCSGNSVSSACSFTFTTGQSQSVSLYSALALTPGGNAQAADASALNPTKITVEAWANATMAVPPNNSHVALVSKGSPFTTSGYQLGYFSNGSVLFPEAQVVVAGASGPATGNCRASSAVAPGTTHNLTMVYDSGFVFLTLYVDGTFVCSTTPGGLLSDAAPTNLSLKPATGSPLLFGSTGETHPFGGVLDEVRISNVPLYSFGSFTPVRHPTAQASTVGLWHFDEGTGSAAADSSSTADNAALSGSNSGWAIEP
jgi:Concanavalin A-like lectin/glucanases superfamily